LQSRTHRELNCFRNRSDSHCAKQPSVL
jgi:hypothetical protein